jgi:hypothetical protein
VAIAKEIATIFVRTINGCWFIFRWGLALAIVAALAAGGYFYIHLDDEIRRQVEQRLATHYRDLEVTVGSAQFEQERGITIRDVTIRNPADTTSDSPALTIEEIFLAGNIRINELLSGLLPIREIVIRRPILTASRSTSGEWNTACLLPPPRFSEAAPEMSIEGGTLVLREASQPGKSLTLRKLAVNMTPPDENLPDSAGSVSHRSYQVTGSAEGLPAKRLIFNGRLNTANGAIDLTLGADRLAISRDLLNSLPIQPPIDLSQWDFTAAIDLRFQVVRQSGESARVAWRVDATLDGGRVASPSLPRPITDIVARMVATSERLAIHELSARWGKAQVALACNRTGWSPDAPLGLAVRVQGLEVDRSIAALVPAPAARIWSRFDPTGTIDGTLKLTFHDGKWQPNVTATCRNVSITDHERFPYRVTNAAGRIEYKPAHRGEPDRLLLELNGAGPGTPVSIKSELAHLTTPPAENRRGRSGMASAREDVPTERSVAYRGIESPPQDAATRPHVTGYVEVSAAGVPVNDQSLLAAISHRAPQGSQLITSLHPEGSVDFRWRAEWRERTQPQASTSLDLTLKDCRILCDHFRYPLQNVNGRVTERDRQWLIHDVQGRGPDGQTVVICRGTAAPGDAGHVISLDIQTTNAPLDAALKQALPIGAQRAWDDIQPTGHVDVFARVIKDPARPKLVTDVTLSPRDHTVSIRPRMFPYRLDAVSGAVRYTDGRVEMQNVGGRHGATVHSIHEGTWTNAPDGAWQLSLKGWTADWLELDQELFTALPPGMQQVITRLKPRGAFHIYKSALTFSKRADVPKLASEWDVNLDCHQVSLGGALPLANITGGIRFTGKSDDKETFTEGELAIHSLSFQDMQFTSVSGPIYADPSVCLLGLAATAHKNRSPKALTADAYGGSLTANIRISHEDVSRFRAELALGGADLARFATERLGGPKDLTGVVSGRLSLENVGGSKETLVGQGDLHVVNAHIYELPVLVSTLKVLKNRTPDTTAFNRCDMKFSVQGDRVQFQQLQLLGDAVSLYGQGEADLDRRIDMVFHALAGPADLPIPGVSFLMRQATQQIMEIKVDGSWDKPVTKVNALPTVNNMLEAVASPLDPAPARR